MAIPKGNVKALRLRDVKHDLPGTLWCGPAVLSSITGRRTSVIAELIKTRRYGSEREARCGGYVRSAVKGTFTAELRDVLAHYGLRMWPIYGFGRGARPTLAAWLKSRHASTVNELCIIEVTGHWVAVKGRKFLDSKTRKPVWLKDSPCRRRRVVKVWAVRQWEGRPQAVN